jgi:hypothetical protein
MTRVRVHGAFQSENMPGLLTSHVLPVMQALTAACHYLTQFHQNDDAARAVRPTAITVSACAIWNMIVKTGLA